MLDDAIVAVVVPARNEERLISEVLKGVPSWVDRVIVVDDGSDDGTAGVVKRGFPAVELITHEQCRGVGAAIRSGYFWCLDHGVDVVAVMAGDNQMNPRELQSLVQPIIRGEFDYVKGNRLTHPDVTRVMPWLRRIGTRALAVLTSWVSGVHGIQDAQCGYTAVRAESLQRIELTSLYPRYGYPNDLVVMLARTGARVAERPVTPIYASESSGLRPMLAIFTHSYVLIRAWWLRGRRARRGRQSDYFSPQWSRNRIGRQS